MPGIIKRPTLVAEAVEEFADLFENKCQVAHFANYLTGLMVSENKTVTGITGEFVNASDQSCLNRFLNEVEWNEYELNERRIDLLIGGGDLKVHPRGVIALDNVLIDHTGTHIEDVGWFWDHSEDRYKIAHDYLFVNYVNPDGAHYPLDFLRFKKKNQCEEENVKFVSHTEMFIDLVNWTHKKKLWGTFTFDSYFCSGKILNHIHSLRDERDEVRTYTCCLKSNRTVTFKGVEQSAKEMALSIDHAVKKQITHENGKKQWYFTVCVHVSEVDHKCRIVFLWDKKSDKEPKKILLTNKTNWEINRIVGTYRFRWTGTETFHRDGKQELGMGDCQLRNGIGQTRHMYLVMLAYSLAMRILGSRGLCGWASARLKTVGEVCRAAWNETIRNTIAWVVESVGLVTGKEFHKLMKRLNLAR
jgi:hypothetical protein